MYFLRLNSSDGPKLNKRKTNKYSLEPYFNIPENILTKPKTVFLQNTFCSGGPHSYNIKQRAFNLKQQTQTSDIELRLDAELTAGFKQVCNVEHLGWSSCNSTCFSELNYLPS